MNDLKSALQDLAIQELSLKKQLRLGIIDSVDAANELEMITKKEFLIKKQMVEVVHITRTGALRSISSGNPSSSYPKGYVYTKLEGGRLVKAKDLESLYLRLYDIYYGTSDTFSIDVIFDKAIKEKQETENPKARTIMRYQNQFNKYFSSELRGTDIRTITDHDLKKYTQDLVTNTSLTNKEFLAYKCLLNLIFSFACITGVIEKNPVLMIKNSVYLKSCDYSKATSEEKILTQDEIAELVEEAKGRADKNYYVYYYALRFSAATGARVGEICSLKWSDIDFDNLTIHIHSQQLCEWIDKKVVYYYVPYTKNERSHPNGGRYFPLTDELSDLFQELAKEQKALGINPVYVFSDKDGEWITTKKYSNFLYKLCRKHGLNVTNNHALRMSLNSNVLIKSGMLVTDRARLLGHSVSTNLNNYSYAQKDCVESARNVLNQATNHREPFEGFREPFAIPFPKHAKSPQTLSL